MYMAEVTVTRNHQVTLTKDVREKLGIREGDKVVVNVLGDVAVIAKRDADAFRDAPSFLPEDFYDVLSEVRGDPEERLRDLGLV